jgi:hypothetical protein
MKMTLKFVVILLIVCTRAHAQVVPEANGPSGLPVGRNLHYAFRYAETAETGGDLGNWQTVSPSASVSYANGSRHLPFDIDYTGGYTWGIAGPAYGVGVYQHLFLSQGWVGEHWSLLGSDDVSYLPQSPTTGFSGVAGSGDLTGGTGSGTTPTQSILTLNTHTVNNVASGEVGYHLNFATELSAGGSSMILDFPNNDGLNTDEQTANAGITWRLNARNIFTGQYVFDRFSYPDSNIPFNFDSTTVVVNDFSDDDSTVLVSYKREWTRQITTTIAVGPQWTSSSLSSVIPSTTTIAGNATLEDRLHFGSINVGVSRGANGGGGYLIGGEVDSVNGGLTREFGKDLTVGLSGAYMHTTGLLVGTGNQSNQDFNATFGGAEVSKRFGEFVSAFASYTAIDQTATAATSANLLNQLIQVVGFGIEYSPRDKHFSQ